MSRRRAWTDGWTFGCSADQTISCVCPRQGLYFESVECLKLVLPTSEDPLVYPDSFQEKSCLPRLEKCQASDAGMNKLHSPAYLVTWRLVVIQYHVIPACTMCLFPVSKEHSNHLQPELDIRTS